MIQNRTPACADRLPEVRQLLARLHQVLVSAEREELERDRGRPVGGAEFLHMLVTDERLAWLRPMGRLAATLDEFLKQAERRGAPVSEDAARDILIDVRRVVARTTGLHAGWRYADWAQRDPEVVLAHAALTDALRPEPKAWAA
jgi:hypothetical protein